MQLFLLRHAHAAAHASSDAARELTPHGIEQAKRVGKFCRKHELTPELILCSPFRRAEQTAQLFAEEVQREIVLADFLASGMNPERALAELGGYTKFESVMMVGHEPDLSRLAATLLGLASSEGIYVRKASLILLGMTEVRAGAAMLDFSLPEHLL